MHTQYSIKHSSLHRQGRVGFRDTGQPSSNEAPVVFWEKWQRGNGSQPKETWVKCDKDRLRRAHKSNVMMMLLPLCEALTCKCASDSPPPNPPQSRGSQSRSLLLFRHSKGVGGPNPRRVSSMYCTQLRLK